MLNVRLKFPKYTCDAKCHNHHRHIGATNSLRDTCTATRQSPPDCHSTARAQREGAIKPTSTREIGSRSGAFDSSNIEELSPG